MRGYLTKLFRMFKNNNDFTFQPGLYVCRGPFWTCDFYFKCKKTNISTFLRCFYFPAEITLSGIIEIRLSGGNLNNPFLEEKMADFIKDCIGKILLNDKKFRIKLTTASILLEVADSTYQRANEYRNLKIHSIFKIQYQLHKKLLTAYRNTKVIYKMKKGLI